VPLFTRPAPVQASERRLGRRAGVKYGGGASWLVTFVDLISLMLAFFVMMFAMTTLDAPRFDRAAASITLELGKTVSPVEREPPEPLSVRTESQGRGYALDYLKPILTEKLARDPILRSTSVTGAGDRLVIALPTDLLFTGGGATLSNRARVAICELATALAPLPNRIALVGHADPRPTQRDGPYASNWALSLARADAVARMLAASGYTGRPTIEGQGDSRFSEVAPTLPLESRYALARRVDVVILPERAP